MRFYAYLALGLTSLLFGASAQAQTVFDHTSGDHLWNVADNWTPDDVPNSPGASAILPSPTAHLTIDLGEPITVGSLEINKPLAPNSGNTTLIGTNTLTFSGGTMTLLNRGRAVAEDPALGTGVSVMDVPMNFDSTLNVIQQTDDQLRFQEPLSGTGDLSVSRGGFGGGGRSVVFAAANTYTGPATIFTGSGGDDWLIVRLNHAAALPATTNVSLANSAIVELAAGDFTRPLGTGAGEIQFSGAARNGFAAFDGDRVVNLGGNPTPSTVVWGNGPGQANFGQFALGAPTANATVNFVNPLDLNGSNRIIRMYDGAAAIDGRMSGAISGTGQLRFVGEGTLSLAAANSWSGTTTVEDGMVVLEHSAALPGGNLTAGTGAIIGIAADTAPGDPNADFARDLGNGSGQLQFISIGNDGNRSNAGFAAFGGNRTVILNGGATIQWGVNSFLSGNSGGGGGDRKLILNQNTSDGTLIFANPLDFNGAERTVVTRNGTTDIDGELSGVLSGTGAGLRTEGAGALALTASNTYDGGTTVTQGRLLVNNTMGSGTGSGPVAVTGGRLGGTGSIAGTVTVAAGARIAPGVTGIESLDVGGLTLEADSILEFDLGAPGNSDLLNVTIADGLTINGGTVNLLDAGGLAAGNYTLIDYAGTLQGSSIATFLSQTPIGPTGFIYTLVDTGSTIDLAVMADASDVDFNDDGIADAADYVIWRKFNGAVGTGTANTGDANGDTNVDELDYNEWRENFGSTIVPPPPGTGNGGAVPEPSSIVLLALGVIIALHRRSKCNRV